MSEATGTPISGVYFWSHGNGGVHFHRMAEPARVLKKHSANVHVGQRLDDPTCYAHDTIVVHMLWEQRQSVAWEKLARSGKHRLVYDVDDNMWSPDWQPFANHYTPEVLGRVENNIRMAHVVTTPSPYLAEFLRRFNANVHLVPNSIPESLTKRTMHDRPRPVLGYQGSPSHLADLARMPEIGREIGRFLRFNPEWNLHVWGANPEEEPREIWGDRVRHIPWKDSLIEYYKTVSMDIGLGFLADTEFNRGKSALRVQEFSALGIVPVVSKVEAYESWVEQGETGYLIGPRDSWYEVLSWLARNPEVRRTVGLNARNAAAAWTTEASINTWLEAWNSA